MSPQLLKLSAVAAAVLIATCAGAAPQAPPAPSIAPVLVDATAQYGLTRYTQTFAAAFADLDNDGDDDLVVSNHGRNLALYLNQDGHFVDRSDLWPPTHNDRHGLTVYDLDGDGDRDIALATGGGGVNFSVGGGSESQLFANRLMEEGELELDDVSEEAGFGFREWRGRWFMPMPLGRVHLVFEAQGREGRPDLFLQNLGGLRFARVFRPRFERNVDSEGVGTLWDYDRDGNLDVLTRDSSRVRILRGRGGWFQDVEFLELAGTGVNSLAAGDLDRDGYPDVVLGGREGRGDEVFLNRPGEDGQRHFERVMHLPHQEWTRSIALVDLDANGWLDVVMHRGQESGVAGNGARFALMFDGTAFERFDLPPANGGNADDVIVGFVDGDQRPDLFATNGWGLAPTNIGPYELWLNRTAPRYQAVTVRLRGAAPNTDAIGAQVEISGPDAQLIGYRMLAPRGQAQDSTRIHFGVGMATGPFRIAVTWANGARTERAGVRPGEDVVIVQQ